MAKKKELPSDNSIESKKDAFRELIEKIARDEVNVISKKQTVVDKLELIKEELSLLKDKNIPYSAISKLIEDNFDLKISEQTLRKYCQERLGFPKKTKAIKDKVVPRGTVAEREYINKQNECELSRPSNDLSSSNKDYNL